MKVKSSGKVHVIVGGNDVQLVTACGTYVPATTEPEAEKAKVTCKTCAGSEYGDPGER